MKLCSYLARHQVRIYVHVIMSSVKIYDLPKAKLQKTARLGGGNEIYFILSFSSILRIRFLRAGTTRAIGSHSP